MTIEDAVKAARACATVVFEDPMLGPMVFARICEITKRYRTPAEIEHGKEPETYYLTLESMRCPGRSQHIVPPELVRIATAEDVVRSGIPDELERRKRIAERAAAAAPAAEAG